MIFATCGSSHFRFDRMMAALAALPPEELYVQHGPAEPPAGVRAVRFLPFEELVASIASADVVVSHAGVGSILCAIRAGHTPVVFPRLKRYGETVDDHQAELAAALSARGSAISARSAEELVAAVAAAPPRQTVGQSHSRGLVAAVRASIVAGSVEASDLRGGARRPRQLSRR